LRPTVTDDLIYEETLGGGLKAISPGGRLIWSAAATTKERFIGAPAVGPDRIFISGATGFWAIAR
jgi:hypothetical protein